MKKQNIRVMLASEHLSVRYFLKDIVGGEDGVVVVAQADNAIKAFSLAKSLRPDISIIDTYLPHAIGLDTVPLSRISGLDTAQAISKEIPNSKVVILTDLDIEGPPEPALVTSNIAFLCRKTNGSYAPFTLKELYQETAPLSPLVFATVGVQPGSVLWSRIADLSDKALLFGGFGIMGGLALMLTVVGAGAGVFLAGAGVVTVALGLSGKLLARFHTRAISTEMKIKRN